jgi:hypothetical protein
MIDNSLKADTLKNVALIDYILETSFIMSI